MKISLKYSHESLKLEEEKNRALMRKTIIEKEAVMRNKDLKQTDKTPGDLKYKCRECDNNFLNKACLLKHRTKRHSTQLTCITCNQNFEESAMFKEHMIAMHKIEKQYKCDQCDSAFVVEWRLQKHRKNHQRTVVRKCHYFNNRKECPFLQLGCKFLHEESYLCKNNKKCTILKCQYQHS